jgi:hypothetical protein
MKPLRYEYGTPRYQVAPGVESTSRLDMDSLPAVPRRIGWYLLHEGEWVATDGLTYRERGNVIYVREVAA